jgi:hypothetical protein
MQVISPEIPEILIGLFQGKADMRGAKGGRGSGKTFSFCKVLAYYGAVRKLRIVCGREIQLTITDSVFFELKNAIELCPYLTSQYEIGRSFIRSAIGTEFLFKGMRHNISEIKGLGQIDYFWIDEAEAVSEESWRELIPTIRKDGSEIWATWNPKSPDSKVNQIFSNSENDELIKCVTVNYTDNPWFPEKLERERLRSLELDDEDVYQHIWEGGFLINIGRPVFDKKHTAKALAECWSPIARMVLEGNKFVERDKGELRVWELPRQDEQYFLGADVAGGLAHGDWSCCNVLNSKGQQVAQWHGKIAPDLFGEVCFWLGKMYNYGLLGIEVNFGDSAAIKCRDMGYPYMYVRKELDNAYTEDKQQSKLGWLTTSKSKRLIIDMMSAALREGTHGMACADTARECQTYIIDDKGGYNAQSGAHDDRILAYAIALEMLRTAY